MRPIELRTPAQSSVGGNVFFRGLAAALGDKVEKGKLSLSNAALAQELDLPTLSDHGDDSRVSLHLGASVEAQRGTNIFWPLSVAPVEKTDSDLLGKRLLDRARPRLMRLKLRQAIRKADRLIFSSEHAKGLYLDSFSSLKGYETTVIKTGHSIDPVSGFERTMSNAEGTFVLLWVGNAYAYKGLLESIEAVLKASVESQRPLRLEVVGQLYDDSVGDIARRAARDRPDLIRLHGSRPGDELVNFYSDADAFLFTSRTENYGSFALADAFRFALPTISNGLSSNPEMNEGAAIEISPSDTTAMAKAIVTLASDSAEYSRWMNRSAERGRRLANWHQVADNVLAVLEDCS